MILKRIKVLNIDRCKKAVAIVLPLILALLVEYFWIDGIVPFGVFSVIFGGVFGVGSFAVWYNGSEVYDKLFKNKQWWCRLGFEVVYFLMWSGVMISLLLMML